MLQAVSLGELPGGLTLGCCRQPQRCRRLQLLPWTDRAAGNSGCGKHSAGRCTDKIRVWRLVGDKTQAQPRAVPPGPPPPRLGVRHPHSTRRRDSWEQPSAPLPSTPGDVIRKRVILKQHGLWCERTAGRAAPRETRGITGHGPANTHVQTARAFGATRLLPSDLRDLSGPAEPRLVMEFPKTHRLQQALGNPP